MAVSKSMSARTASNVPSGSASNAASVGANTVNGPAPFSVSTRSAAMTAVSRVVWSALLTMMSTTVFEGGGGEVTVTVPTMPERAWVPTEQS